MTKHTIPTFCIILMMMSSALIAQDVQKEAPAPAAKTCHMGDCCAKMKQAPKNGFHCSVEWNGIYGGPDNEVSYRIFGHTFNQNYRRRDAIHVNAGYQFNPYLYIGGGIGAEFQYKTYWINSWSAFMGHYTSSLVVMPIYGEIKGYLLKKPISPFLQLRIGYAPILYVLGHGFSTIAENSSYNNISIGVRIYSHVSITAGYLFMYQPTSVLGYDPTDRNNVMLDRSNPYQHMATVGIVIGM